MPVSQRHVAICSCSPQVEYIPGGATQNTIRIAQTLLQKSHPNSCAFAGCVGKDSYAEQMRKACADAGFTPLYLEVGLRVHWRRLLCHWVGRRYYTRGFYDDLNILSTLPECIMSIIPKASENSCVCVSVCAEMMLCCAVVVVCFVCCLVAGCRVIRGVVIDSC